MPRRLRKSDLERTFCASPVKCGAVGRKSVASLEVTDRLRNANFHKSLVLASWEVKTITAQEQQKMIRFFSH